MAAAAGDLLKDVVWIGSQRRSVGGGGFGQHWPCWTPIIRRFGKGLMVRQLKGNEHFLSRAVDWPIS